MVNNGAETAAREVGFIGFCFYPRSGFIHVDLGPARQWGQRFPVRATAFAAETPPAREVLEETLPRISGRSKLAEALRYAIARREIFERFLTDGLVELDSNIVERAIRP